MYDCMLNDTPYTRLVERNVGRARGYTGRGFFSSFRCWRERGGGRGIDGSLLGFRRRGDRSGDAEEMGVGRYRTVRRSIEGFGK